MRYLIAFVFVLTLCVQARGELHHWPFLAVVDADTLAFEAPWVPLDKKVILVRLLGIDTPEKGHRAQCEKERLEAEEATRFATVLINKSKDILIETKRWDKYSGRVLGIVYLDGKSLNDTLIETGYARPYHGEKKSSWCNVKG